MIRACHGLLRPFSHNALPILLSPQWTLYFPVLWDNFCCRLSHSCEKGAITVHVQCIDLAGASIIRCAGARLWDTVFHCAGVWIVPSRECRDESIALNTLPLHASQTNKESELEEVTESYAMEDAAWTSSRIEQSGRRGERWLVEGMAPPKQ